jgi:hypothetical protein
MERTLLFHIQRKEELAAMAAKYARVEGVTLVEHTDTLLHYVLTKDDSHLIFRTSLPPHVGTLFGETAGAGGEPLFPWLSMLTGYVVDDLAAGVAEMEAADLAVLQRGADWYLLIDPAKPVYGIILLREPLPLVL